MSSKAADNVTKLRSTLDGGIDDASAAVLTGRAVGSDNGDNPKTLTARADKPTQVWATALTADRAVTLSTSAARSGDRFRIVRKAGATGAFNLNVGTGPLKALTAGQWCDVEFDGSAWFLAAYGAL